MALDTGNGLFIHIPKSAGVTIRNVLRAAFPVSKEIGGQHTHFPELFDYHDLSFFDSRFVFSFIRHPITWYQSRWAFRLKHGWQPNHPLDYYCASNDFGTFLHNCYRKYPKGWLTAEYTKYLEYKPGLINFVGKHENLESDLGFVLAKLGKKLDSNSLRGMPKYNTSQISGLSSSELAIYTPSLKDLVLNMEHKIIEKYYVVT